MDWYSFCSIAPNNHLLSLGEISRKQVDTPRVLLTFSSPFIHSLYPFVRSSRLLRLFDPTFICWTMPSKSAFLAPRWFLVRRRRSLGAKRQRWWRRRYDRRHIHAAKDSSSWAWRSVFSGLNGVYLFPLFWSCSEVTTSSIMSTKLYSVLPFLSKSPSLFVFSLPRPPGSSSRLAAFRSGRVPGRYSQLRLDFRSLGRTTGTR